ncbi:TPA: hypothetical protein ENS27_13500 [bacterium]|nr:hypothetical protein [bacterium]
MNKKVKIKFYLLLLFSAVLVLSNFAKVLAAGGDRLWSKVRDDKANYYFPTGLDYIDIDSSMGTDLNALYMAGLDSNLTKWAIESRNSIGGFLIRFNSEGSIGTNSPYAVDFHTYPDYAVHSSGIEAYQAGGPRGDWKVIKMPEENFNIKYWEAVDQLGISCAAIAYDVVANNYGVFAAGFRNNNDSGDCNSYTPSWRVERRNFNYGNLIWEIDNNRELSSFDGADTAYRVVSSGNYIYIAGQETDASGSKARLEKRDPNGNLQSGWPIKNSENCTRRYCALEVSNDGSFIYWTIGNRFRKIDPQNGNILLEKNLDITIRDIAVDPTEPNITYVIGDYTNGTFNGKNYWTIEKLDYNGEIIWRKMAYDSTYSYASTLHANPVANSITADTEGIYIAGRKNYNYQYAEYEEGKGTWRIEKRDKSSTGALTITASPTQIKTTENTTVGLGSTSSTFTPNSIQFALDKNNDGIIKSIESEGLIEGWSNVCTNWGSGNCLVKINEENIGTWNGTNIIISGNNFGITNLTSGLNKKIWAKATDGISLYTAAADIKVSKPFAIVNITSFTPTVNGSSGTLDATVETNLGLESWRQAQSPFKYELDCNYDGSFNADASYSSIAYLYYTFSGVCAGKYSSPGDYYIVSRVTSSDLFDNTFLSSQYKVTYTDTGTCGNCNGNTCQQIAPPCSNPCNSSADCAPSGLEWKEITP